MENRINTLFNQKKNNILSIYMTSGYPSLADTVPTILALQESGVDMIELGMPFSDPLADGPIIQESSTKAIENGMTIAVLFDQIKEIRKTVSIPLVLMGYINPVLQYGVVNFCKKASEVGIDGIIIPDLPLQEFLDEYKQTFEENNLKNIFLITPQTSEARVRLIDSHSDGFIYMVSSSSTTGTKSGTADSQLGYFDRINSYNLKNPRVIGFGISNKTSFNKACEHASGAIIGSAFVKHMNEQTDIKAAVNQFVCGIIDQKS